MPNAKGVPEDRFPWPSATTAFASEYDTDLRLAMTAKIREVFRPSRRNSIREIIWAPPRCHHQDGSAKAACAERPGKAEAIISLGKAWQADAELLYEGKVREVLSASNHFDPSRLRQNNERGELLESAVSAIRLCSCRLV